MFNRFFYLILLVSLWIQFHGWASLAKAQEPPSFMATLAYLTSLREFSVDTGVYFEERDKEKNKILWEILLKHGLTKGVFWDQQSQTRINLHLTKKPISIPNLEVRKIHAAKYRIRIHNARGDFPLNFSETFHKDWRLYLVPWSFKDKEFDSTKTQQILSSYQILSGNKKSQASSKELKEFIKKGWVTDIEHDPPSLTNPYHLIKRIGGNASRLKTLKTDFISKKFFNTIQNENLPTGLFWETWFAGAIDINCNTKNKGNCEPTNSDTWRVIKGFNPTVIEWPNQLHWRINAQTNGWWINSNFLRHASLSANKKTTFHQINSDGTLSFELVMEFWPQRLFYAGGIISIMVLLTTLIVLFLRWIRQQFIPKSL